MNIVYVSSYMTHHTRPLGEALYAMLGGGFAFVETKPRGAAEEAFRMGYAYSMADGARPPWLLAAWEHPARARQIILAADAVVTANCPDSWVLPRLRARKLTFRAHERWYRKGLPWYRLPRAVLGGWLHHGRFASLHLLAASAYTASDAACVGCYRGKAYRWGYFPAFRAYSTVPLRRNDEPVVLWAGRFVDCKRADDALAACRMLWEAGYRFHLNMVGSGPEEKTLRALGKKLGESVSFPGVLTTERLRDAMEQSDIFLFTSDFQEGWGAVLNEAMNSGCAVVASHAAGGTPYLVRDGENGLIYPCGDVSALAERLRRLLDSPALCRSLGRNAYETIRTQWSPSAAAKRLVELCGDLLAHRPPREQSGPCSPAPMLENDWYGKE